MGCSVGACRGFTEELCEQQGRKQPSHHTTTGAQKNHNFQCTCWPAKTKARDILKSPTTTPRKNRRTASPSNGGPPQDHHTFRGKKEFTE
ncbi:hypothetical protein P7K49_012224, partial [Saguinus oedipus]